MNLNKNSMDEEYIYWHMVMNVYPKAKRLMKSKIKNGDLMAFKKQMDEKQILKDDKTGHEMRYHDFIFLGKTIKGESKEETNKQIKQFVKDLKDRLKKRT